MLSRPIRRLLPSCLGIALLGVFPVACGDDDGAVPRVPSAGAGGASGGAGGKAGSKSGGKAGTKSGGKSGGGSTGQTAGEGGASGGPADDAGSAGEGARGAQGGSGGANPDFCSRLRNPTALAGTVSVDFDNFTADADCRVAGIPWLYVYTTDGTYQRAAFLNELLRFNLALWGCSSKRPTTFSLIYEQGLLEDPRPITSADARALIEDYLIVATRDLQLSPAEASAVEAKLLELSASVVTLDSEDFSRSNCSEGAGGEGGAGGEAGAAGQGGASGEAGFGGAGNEAGSGGQH